LLAYYRLITIFQYQRLSAVNGTQSQLGLQWSAVLHDWQWTPTFKSKKLESTNQLL